MNSRVIWLNLEGDFLMLDKIDLNKKIQKRVYKEVMPILSQRLYNLQKATWDAKMPIVIIFEGWDAAGKGTSIQTLTNPLDPRGFKLYPIRAARTYERNHPWLWRFWLKLPAYGEWAIFDRSWYGRVMVERVENLIPESKWRRAYRDITEFERTIADDGTLIIKFFLHISKEEQKRRFDTLVKNPLTSWQVTDEDWDHHQHYGEWLMAYEEAFERTDTEFGPWTIVEATNRRYTRLKIFLTLIAALQERIDIDAEPLPTLAELEAAGNLLVSESSIPDYSNDADGRQSNDQDSAINETPPEHIPQMEDQWILEKDITDPEPEKQDQD
jgi:polyphosphate kinase 2 (PPK2 family)